MGWRDTARAVKEAGHNRHDRHIRGSDEAIVPNGPIVPALDTVATLRRWHSHLAPLDLHAPPEGIQPNRWAQLVEDSWWLYENFGSQLAREGWDDLSAWGVLPWREGGGVLLDRLQGARNLKLSGDGRAYWTSYGVTFSTCRGLGETLVSSGLQLVWDLTRFLEAFSDAELADGVRPVSQRHMPSTAHETP